MAARGSYAKGVAKREEILTTALDVIARNGYRGASVRELADAVGLSQAGLLHYFSSKEELFTEVLRKRDEVDAATYLGDGGAPVDGMIATVRHNAEVPGLVRLYAQVSIEATDHDHPSRAHFTERYEALRQLLSQVVRDEQSAGRVDPELDPEHVATLFAAAADGLQNQWLLDPSIDMADQLAYFWRLVTRHP
ncbi:MULTISPECIES: TetR/AcrR family transcriptional regulator [unclassified Nocardioides]|uniref:TetR/AcrR family transcriptional regulator n=1 Tax=unclassified Nocardioides TaxID=2615069 RepID=UPI0006F360D4|nr:MULTISPECIES: TetR/AcrR family transcriptional regulator [unclassified Nocardioides]KRA38489.1 TetR family transcriptional regulator [Nocardioides sp. Root614]KRA92449.1 TetR family transcriptional regulator [Nocardioides sp. Root682]